MADNSTEAKAQRKLERDATIARIQERASSTSFAGLDIDSMKTGAWNWLDLLFTLMFDSDNYHMKCRVYGYCTEGQEQISSYAPPDASDESLTKALEDGLGITGKGYLLRPDLIKAATAGSSVEKYLFKIFEEVQKHNETPDATKLDPILIANQLWQESKFDPNLNKGEDGVSIGIAQFKLETAKEYGLSEQDLLDPNKAIPAAIKHMGKLTGQLHSQPVAMIAYNGGLGAVDHVAKQLNISRAEITIEQWMHEMGQERMEKGLTPKTAWRVVTYDYIKENVSTTWTAEKQAEAAALLKVKFESRGYTINPDGSFNFPTAGSKALDAVREKAGTFNSNAAGETPESTTTNTPDGKSAPEIIPENN